MKSDNSFAAFIKSHGNIGKLLALLGVAVIAFLLLGNDKTEAESTADTVSETEEKIAALCESVEGVGKCRVMITLSKGESSTVCGSTVVSTSPAEIRGITVVCEGGDSPSVAAELTDMLAALYRIGTNRVKVLKLSS